MGAAVDAGGEPSSALARDAVRAIAEMRGHVSTGWTYEEVRALWTGVWKRRARETPGAVEGRSARLESDRGDQRSLRDMEHSDAAARPVVPWQAKPQPDESAAHGVGGKRNLGPEEWGPTLKRPVKTFSGPFVWENDPADFGEMLKNGFPFGLQVVADCMASRGYDFHEELNRRAFLIDQDEACDQACKAGGAPCGYLEDFNYSSCTANCGCCERPYSEPEILRVRPAQAVRIANCGPCEQLFREAFGDLCDSWAGHGQFVFAHCFFDPSEISHNFDTCRCVLRCSLSGDHKTSMVPNDCAATVGGA